MNKIQKIAVVPIESPPLYISSASRSGPNIPAGSPSGAVVLGIVVGILILLDLPEEAKRSAKLADSMESILNAEETWIPTVVFAREAGKQIATQGKHEVTVVQNIRKFHDLVNRERTKTIVKWYNEETSQFDYKSLKNQQIDAVLEVGIWIYGVWENEIGLGVMLKLVDPMSGNVLGRVRDHEWLQQKTNGLFQNNGQQFKDIFSTLGAKLISKNLKDIGLKPE
jgi:hypothetical protein